MGAMRFRNDDERDAFRGQGPELGEADDDCPECMGDGGHHEGVRGMNDPETVWVVCPCRLSKEMILARVRIMAKVTSKRQVTIPKAIADQYGIEPGDEIEFQAAGEVIRVVPPNGRRSARLSVAERLRLFDEATARQKRREEGMKLPDEPAAERDWKREDLYTRGEPG